MSAVNYLAAAARRTKLVALAAKRLGLSDEEGGVDNVALQCDRSQRLVWALGGHGGEEEAPRQFAFDELLEQHYATLLASGTHTAEDISCDTPCQEI